MKKEKTQPNIAEPTLFVGVGGIGSKIVKGVAEMCGSDNIDAVRFVTLDTDVNDLTKLESGAVVTTIQTSSPRSVRDYLEDDTEAKEDWFPVNNIINDKTVSEGAGQVRAISRLALNATIKNGNIRNLYKAIDDLFNKDGNDKNQAIKVIIASTAAGGTGSGIAMEAGMLIRHYLKQNYPESAAIIRGYLVLPGVMNNTVISNESERDSLRRNGYATMREINAFMMKGSGFFDSDPRLYRYKDLHISVPTTGGGYVKLDNLPFDFCFLLDSIDGSQRNTTSLDKYIEGASRSLYEQNIGSMRSSARSKEDNVIKEFTDPKKLGRCRFGAAGASSIVYPVEDIYEYLALDWAQKLLTGKSTDGLSDQEIDRLVGTTWLKYDARFEADYKEWENEGSITGKDAPKRGEKYVEYIENAQGDNFAESVFNKYLKSKIASVRKVESISQLKEGSKVLVDDYFKKLVEETVNANILTAFDPNGNYMIASSDGSEATLTEKYQAINELEYIGRNPRLEGIVANFITGVFSSDASVSRGGLKPYMLQQYLTHNSEAIHPNAVRYLLYKLQAKFEKMEKENPEDIAFISDIEDIKSGDERDYSVTGVIGKETTLEEMCDAIDESNKLQSLVNGDAAQRCKKYLDEYFARVEANYRNAAIRVILKTGKPFIDRLIASYEKFYNTFKDKSAAITKKKENIEKKLRFYKGDCVWKLFNHDGYLATLAEEMKGNDGGLTEKELFASIQNLIRENAEIDKRRANDEYSDEVPHDVFDEVMIGHYRKLVELQKSEDLDLDVLHAIKLEYKIKCDYERKNAPESKKLELLERSKKDDELKKYIKDTINKGRVLATPGICKKSFEESRDVNAIAYSEFVKDGDGLRVSDFFEAKGATATVSKYEVRFFRSVYVIEPTQLFQFSAPLDSGEDVMTKVDIIDTDDKSGAGESFTKYQLYMEDVGPDSRTNSVITPHIDRRWNSISVMPEIDLNYQAKLMKHIHQAMFYGFTYGIITRYCPSPKYDPDTFIYRYSDGENGFKKFVVSNGSSCDELYEVLDSLYFDRAAVKSIHEQVSALRQNDIEGGVHDYEKTDFAKRVEGFKRSGLIENTADEAEFDETKASIFELPILYYNSLPARLKDANEIEVMIDAIMDAVESEIVSFSKSNNAYPLFCKTLKDHFNLLYDNYVKFPKTVGNEEDIVSNDVMLTIRRKVADRIRLYRRNVEGLKG